MKTATVRPLTVRSTPNITPIITLLCLLTLGQPARASESWRSNPVTLGSVNVEGGLEKEYVLSRLSGGPAEFEFPLTLAHVIREIGVGQAALQGSDLEVRQLQSWVEPAGRDRLVWHQPGGTVEVFDRAKITRDFADLQSARTWQARWRGRSGQENFSLEFRHRKNGWVYTYEQGQLVRLSAPSGRSLEFRSEAGAIETIHDQTGRLLVEARYDPDGRLTELQSGPDHLTFERDRVTGQLERWNRNGRAGAELDYNRDLLLSAITYPDQRRESFTWRARQKIQPSGRRSPEKTVPVLLSDAAHRYSFDLENIHVHLSATDQNGATSYLSYNTKSGEVVTTDASGARITLHYQSEQGEGQQRLDEVVDPDGQTRLRYDTDTDGQLTGIHRRGLPYTSIRRDELGRVTEVRQGDTVTARYAYASRTGALAGLDQPTRITNALGHSLKMSYDRQGQLSHLTDLNGGEHRFSHDEQGRVVSRQLPYGYTTSQSYDEYGRVIAKTDPDGSSTKVRFNSYNQVAGIERSLRDGSSSIKEHWEYSYDDLGRLTAQTKNGKTWVQRQYLQDASGQLAENSGVQGAVRALVETNPQGHQSRQYFDGELNLLATTNAKGETMRYTYDQADRPTGWTDAKGSVVEFQRDVLGRLEKQVDPLGNITEFQYDQLGRLAEKQLASNDRIRYGYDQDSGRLTEIDYGKGHKVQYDYNAKGQIEQTRTGDTTSDYAYDALGRLAAVKTTLPDGSISGVGYTYTPGGQKESVTLFRRGVSDQPGAQFASVGSESATPLLSEDAQVRVNAYTYDQLGRVTSLAVDDQTQITYHYDEQSLKLAEKEYANGMTIAYSYDAHGRMTGMDAQGTPQGRYQVDYTWNDYGQLASRQMKGRDSTVLQWYDYDMLGRLESVKVPGRPELHESYRYDALGNITEKTVGGVVTKMEYNAANQLTHLASPEKLASFEYDKNGRMVSEITKELAALNAEGNTVAPAKTSVVNYSYGYLDKVLSVNRDGSETKFHYNADGMLVGKQHVSPDSAGGRESANSQEPSTVEPWIWDGLALAMKDGMTFASESHFSGGAAVLATPVDGEVQDTRMLLNDHLGTTLAIFGADAPGNVHTSSFGKALGGSSDTAMFTGKPYDADLGAHVFAFRNYRSDLARWTSADPAGYPDGPNQQFYAPVPTHGLDPLGLQSQSESTTINWSSEHGAFDVTYALDWSISQSPTLQTQTLNGGVNAILFGVIAELHNGRLVDVTQLKDDDDNPIGWKGTYRFEITITGYIGLNVFGQTIGYETDTVQKTFEDQFILE